MTATGRHRATALAAARPGRARRRILIAAGVVVVLVLAVVVTRLAIAAEDPELVVGDTVVADDYDRAATAGSWGLAPTGGDYALTLPSAFSLDGAVASATPPRSGSSVTATVGSVSAGDVLVATTISPIALPTAGNGVYSGVQLRSAGGSHYLVSVRIDPAGAAWLSLLRVVGSTAAQVALVRDVPVGAGLTAGSVLHLEAQVHGTDAVDLRARAWLDGAEAPDWQAVTEDAAAERIVTPGAIGLWTYSSGSSEPVTVAYDDLLARLLVPPTATPPVIEPPAPGEAPTIEGVRGTPGSAPVGSTTYAVPEGALFVSPTGVDIAAGTEIAPFATLPAAIAAAPAGATIVLRAGEYHGTVIVPGHKGLTIQSYPGEAVWLDGSRVVENWEPEGEAWVASGWTTSFDASPTYSRGAPDGTTAGWQFVNPLYPMAAHPDQVWIDDVAQLQVGTVAELVPGTFLVDTTGQRLLLGSDPTGAVVRASDTVKALVIAGTDSTVRGIGIRRFAPSVPDIGAVAVSATGVTIENVEITDSATTGLAIFAADTTLTDVTIRRSGMLGAQASWADGLVATGLLLADNNTEHFNRAPVSGGFKIHKSRGVTVADSAILGNRGNGLWFDESVYDMTVTGNDIKDSIGNGLVIELSAEALVADNVIAGSERDGVLVSESGHVDIWNNTIVANFRSINITQGDRRASDLSLPGHDSRQTLPDPTVTWITEDVSVSNNVMAEGRGKCILCVEDYSHERSAAQMDVRSNGNVFQRISVTEPSWAIVWSRGPGNPQVFTTIAAFHTATGQDASSVALDGTPAVEGARLAPAVESLIGAVAQPLPAAVAAAVGRAEDDRHLGVWFD